MKKDRNTQLMLDCGSKTGRWSPEPSPDLNLYIRKYSSDAKMRFIACLKSCTTERIPPSPYAKDKNDKAVNLEYFAKDLGWALQTVRNIASEVAADGVCRLQKGRVWICADIPLAFNERTKSEDKYRVHGITVDYPADSIETEKTPNCRIFASEYDRTIAAYEEWRPTLYRDGMASLRAIDQRVKHSIDERFGIPLKPPTQKKPAKESTSASLQLELTLLVEPDFLKQTNGEENYRVHGYENGNRVHGINGNPVHGNVSLLNTELDKEQNSSSREAGIPETSETAAAAVAAKLEGIPLPTAKLLIQECRKSSPGCSIETITAVIDQQLANRPKPKRGQRDNPVGWCIATVPAEIEPYLAAMARTRTRRGKPEPTREQQMEACRDLSENPDLPESERAHWRQKLAEYDQVGG